MSLLQSLLINAAAINAVAQQEEASVVTLYRSKMRGRARKVLHHQKYINIKQLR